MGGDRQDSYSRLDYRRLIAWPERIRREWPLLEELLAGAPSTVVTDLGCGTGEHARFLVERGFQVVGVDRSPAMLEKAREKPLPDGLSFVEGDLRQLDRLLREPVGAAICLGNTLPHLTGPDDLEAFFGALRRRLADGGPFLLQILNYERIFAHGIRTLPVNVRRQADGSEVVFLRLMTAHEDGTVLFCPSTLRLDPEAESPLTVEASKRVELRGWTHGQIDPALAAAGFADRRYYGTFDRRPYEPLESFDLIAVAR